ncbi:Inner membrane ABC transporter permease protein YcjP [Austwickia sp. TVS 96-490-7B]|uniref:carbohydrate ABC transporter permease n=1 Tax=Austwickia sp. TVS 96-490-7B TaxID=2830843 RepID=UPI001C574FDF|nr:carbohydrate ABC transporter permease [Austwickia sp. TVS 96-490-7B]MBW3084845.1 Inner membrane ABC transporter permease protein YcjP [Austwickia sp. TVS 96-490-7B]
MNTRIRPWEYLWRYALLALMTVIAIGPMAYQLSTSLKSKYENINSPTPQFIPQDPTWDNYVEVTRVIPVWSYIGNSLFVAALVVVGNVIGCTLAGYAMSRLQFRGRKVVLALFLSTLILPGEATIMSQFQMITSMGLANTLWGVALPGLISALNVLLMYNAFNQVPIELDQAAIVDGANTWQRLWHVGIPNVTGSLSIVAIFSFIGAWDDFLWPLLVLSDPDQMTLTVGLSYLNGAFTNNPRVIAAGSMIALVPIVLFFAVLHRYFFQGVGEGAVKG